MSKVEKLACKYLEWKNKRTETESNIISMLSYCLAIWGLIYSWRKKVQKAMNQAVRMLLNCDMSKSMTEGLKEVGWLNMDNLWRLEQIAAMRRICSTQIPEVIFRILTSQTHHRYMVRADGLRSGWWPLNAHGENAFVNLAVKVFNEQRIPQRIWFNDRANRVMTSSEIRETIKNDLIRFYGNENLS